MEMNGGSVKTAEKKYWVPAIERARDVLEMIASAPSKYRLIDLANKLEVNKSSMFSMLHTLESIGWIVKEKGDTYTLGANLGTLSAAYFHQFDLLRSFHEEAAKMVARIHLTIQLGVLDKREVLYLAKEEIRAPHVVSYPGMRIPAHATALGKIQLSGYADVELEQMYADYRFEKLTPYTVSNLAELQQQLAEMRRDGFAYDHEEAVLGFYCLAAPVYNYADQMIAAVSCSLTKADFEVKQALARGEILDLAGRLSRLAGHAKRHSQKE